MDCSVSGIVKRVDGVDSKATTKKVKELLKKDHYDIEKEVSLPINRVTHLVKALNPTLDGKPINILDIVRNSAFNYSFKYTTKDSAKVVEESVSVLSNFKARNSTVSLNTSTLETMYSDQEILGNNDSYESEALDLVNHPEKLREVAQALIEADEYHNDSDHNELLYSRLGEITESLKELTPQITIHINKNADSNGGAIKLDSNDIYINQGVGGSKSLMEVYVHELYHAVTHFALNRKDIRIRKDTARLEEIRHNFLKNTTEERLAELSEGRLNVEQAKKLLDYISDKKVGLHEFVAHAMTNKPVTRQLMMLDTDNKGKSGSSLFHRILDLVYGLFGRVKSSLSNEPTSDDLARMNYLVARLHEIHRKPYEAKRKIAMTNVLSVLNTADEYLSTKIKDLIAKYENPKANDRKEGENSAKYIARVVMRSFFDKNARQYLGNWSSITMPWLFKPEGTIKSLLSDFYEADDVANKAESFAMRSTQIDQHREFLALETAKLVKSLFNRPLEEKEEQALTSVVLDTDLSSIMGVFEIEDLISSPKELRNAINQLESSLKSKTPTGDFNYYKAQTLLLSRYMVEGVGHITLQMNAENIAKKLGTGGLLHDPSEEVVDLIDQLTTLRALQKISSADRKVVTDLYKEGNGDGVEKLIALQYGNKIRSEAVLFPTSLDRINIIKGYSAEITDRDIDVTVAPVKDEEALKAQGYKLVKELSKHSVDSSREGLAFYINSRFIDRSFNRAGLRITDKKRRGTSLIEVHTKSDPEQETLKARLDIARAKDRKAQVIEEMIKGEYVISDDAEDNYLTPSPDGYGKTRDFRYMMTKENKKDLLGLERKVSSVFGRTVASSYDKDATSSFNKQIMDLILEEARKYSPEGSNSRFGKDNKEYIEIGPNSLDESVKEIWKILPKEVKNEARTGFYVRRDLMNTLLGHREASIVGLPFIDKFFDKNPKIYKQQMRYVLMMAEKIVQEIVKVAKVDIVIRTPAVMIGNFISNAMMMVQSGHSLKDIFELKYQGIKELGKYVEGLKELMQLQLKEQSGIANNAEMRRINEIQNNLDNSPVKDLIDEGFYTTIMEELENDNVTGPVSKFINKKLCTVPKFFKDGLDMLYITDSTKVFKLIEKVVQGSDFAARYAQYHLLVEKGVKKEEATRIVRDTYINYSKPNSAFIEYINKMGLAMFTTYFFRIQKVIREYGKTHPSKILLALLGQEYLLGDIEDFTDQSIVTKDLGNLFYNPVDHLIRAVTPTSLEAVSWGLDKTL